MGYGSYSHDAHRALTEARQSLPQQAVFQQRECHALMNPKGVKLRECRDPAEGRPSLGIVFALDVTGSMGTIPERLARKELPEFMKILTACGVPGPQVMFMAVGDATSDRAPLQVGQFETTAELMDQWLTWSFIEGGGGGQNTESYELALYFLAEHTELDCWVKRKKRGYVFMTGDELPYPAVSKHQVEAIVGEKVDDDIPTEAVVAALQETYDPFFLIPDPKRAKRCERRWRDLLGDRAICMDRPEDTCYVAAGIVALTEGVASDLDALARILRDADADPRRIGPIVNALTPYASLLGRDGGAQPAVEKGFFEKLFGK